MDLAFVDKWIGLTSLRYSQSYLGDDVMSCNQTESSGVPFTHKSFINDVLLAMLTRRCGMLMRWRHQMPYTITIPKSSKTLARNL